MNMPDDKVKYDRTSQYYWSNDECGEHVGVLFHKVELEREDYIDSDENERSEWGMGQYARITPLSSWS